MDHEIYQQLSSMLTSGAGICQQRSKQLLRMAEGQSDIEHVILLMFLMLFHTQIFDSKIFFIA